MQLACRQTDGWGKPTGDRTRNPNPTKPSPENFSRWKPLLTGGSRCHRRDNWRKLFAGSGPAVPESLQAALEAIWTQIRLAQAPIRCQRSTYPSLNAFQFRVSGIWDWLGFFGGECPFLFKK